MLLKSFCSVLSLTAGMIILGFCCLMTAFITLVSNLYFLVHFELGVISILVFIVILSMAGAMMVYAAFKESRNLSLFALVLIILTLLMFAIGSVISLANQRSLLEYVCVHDGRRCPETMWGASVDFRKGNRSDHTRGVKGRVQRREPIPHLRNRRQDSPAGEPPDPTEPTTTTSEQTTELDEYELPPTERSDAIEDWEEGYKFGPHLIASAVLFGINFIFLSFCALIVFSYYQELQYFAKVHKH